jgi:Ca2+-binding RTX toxin-like protein
MARFKGTPHQDNLKGGKGDDVFNFTIDDLSAGDRLSGAGGDDVLALQYAGGSSKVAPDEWRGLSSVEGVVLRGSAGPFGIDLGFDNSFFSHNKVKQFTIVATGLNTFAPGLHLSAGSVTNMSFRVAGTIGGIDALKTGKGNDTFLYAQDSLDVNDSISAGGGTDTLVLVGAGKVTHIKDGGTFTDPHGHSFLADIKGIDRIVVTDLKPSQSRQIEFGNLVNTAHYTGSGVVTITTDQNYATHKKAAPIAGELIVQGENLKAKQILHVTGGDNGDQIGGGAGADRLNGGGGKDLVSGNKGNDVLSGGDGNDRLVGGLGADAMAGGAGDDVFIVSDARFGSAAGQFFRDHIDGGGGNDVLSFTSKTGVKLTAAAFGANAVTGIESIAVNGDASNSIAVNDAFLAKNHDKHGYLHFSDGWISPPATNVGLSVDASSVKNARLAVDIEILDQGKNVLKGGAGNDIFDFAGLKTNQNISGLDFTDIVDGGKGKDRILVHEGAQAVLGTGVTDVETVQIVAGKQPSASGVNVNLATKTHMTIDGRAMGSSDSLVVQGFAIDPSTFQNKNATGALTILGGKGSDQLTGGIAGDVIAGGAGSDVLYGRAGADRLTGGGGADDFAFANLGDSSVAAKGQDTITDFHHSEQDKILFLPPIGNANLNFIGTGNFGHNAGEVRYEIDGNNTIVQLDFDGNGAADSEITLNGKINLALSDFAV